MWLWFNTKTGTFSQGASHQIVSSIGDLSQFDLAAIEKLEYGEYVMINYFVVVRGGPGTTLEELKER